MKGSIYFGSFTCFDVLYDAISPMTVTPLLVFRLRKTVCPDASFKNVGEMDTMPHIKF